MLDTFGSRLLIARKELSLNQQDLADQAGIHRAYISNLERGNIQNPTIQVVENLAQALGVQPQYLACWSDNPTGDEPPSSIQEGRVVYQVRSLSEYHLTQDILDEIGDMSDIDRYLALQIIRQINHVRRAPLPEINE